MSARSSGLVIALALIGFAVTLAVMIANRLSDQQVALLTGVICGAGLALPLGIAIGAVVASGRHPLRSALTSPPVSPPASPPIIYMTPPSPAPYTPAAPLRAIEMIERSEPPRRSFKVIGDGDFDDD